MVGVDQFEVSYRSGKGCLIFILTSLFSIAAICGIMLYYNDFSIIGVLPLPFFYIVLKATLYFFFEEECSRFQKLFEKIDCQLVGQEKKWIWF